MLVDKLTTSFEFNKLLKEKIKNFPRHWYKGEHISNIYDHTIDKLSETVILKGQLFSEIYTCPLPEEIMSIHWTQEQVTVFPVIIMKQIQGIVRE